MSLKGRRHLKHTYATQVCFIIHVVYKKVGTPWCYAHSLFMWSICCVSAIKIKFIIWDRHCPPTKRAVYRWSIQTTREFHRVLLTQAAGIWTWLTPWEHWWTGYHPDTCEDRMRVSSCASMLNNDSNPPWRTFDRFTHNHVSTMSTSSWWSENLQIEMWHILIRKPVSLMFLVNAESVIYLQKVAVVVCFRLTVRWRCGGVLWAEPAGVCCCSAPLSPYRCTGWDTEAPESSCCPPGRSLNTHTHK